MDWREEHAEGDTNTSNIFVLNLQYVLYPLLTTCSNLSFVLSQLCSQPVLGSLSERTAPMSGNTCKELCFYIAMATLISFLHTHDKRCVLLHSYVEEQIMKLFSIDYLTLWPMTLMSSQFHSLILESACQITFFTVTTISLFKFLVYKS